jgi:protocatechuate 3,4-dioxygenase alpha subunit
MSKITTTQTIGPFSHEAWKWAVEATTGTQLETSAPTITVSGTIYDGDGSAIDDAQLEAFLPDAMQAEAAQLIPGFRRMPSGAGGEFAFRVSLPQPATRGEPVMYVTVFARGLVKHQFTAVFLEDDTGLAQSAILNQVPEARRPTLLARKTGDGQYRWDIWMQTDKETAFFDYA